MQLLRHSCDVARNQAVGTNGRKQFVALTTGIRCLFLPMSAQSAIANNFSVGFGWDIYFADGADIQMGDKLSYGGQAYIVRGRQPFSGIPMASHLHITAETEHANGQ